MITLEHYDVIAAKVRAPTGTPSLDELCEKFARIVDELRRNQANIVTELLSMYESAAEHNVDVGRDAIFDLAERLTHKLPASEE